VRGVSRRCLGNWLFARSGDRLWRCEGAASGPRIPAYGMGTAASGMCVHTCGQLMGLWTTCGCVASCRCPPHRPDLRRSWVSRVTVRRAEQQRVLTAGAVVVASLGMVLGAAGTAAAQDPYAKYSTQARCDEIGKLKIFEGHRGYECVHHPSSPAQPAVVALPHLIHQTHEGRAPRKGTRPSTFWIRPTRRRRHPTTLPC
jgi:hypothetical protein